MKYSNFDYMKSFSNNDTNFIIEMIDLFIAKAPSDMEKLQSLIAAQAWQEAYKAAHSYKSSVNFVANEVYKSFVVSLEANLKYQKNLKEVKEEFELLKMMNQALIDELLAEKQNL